MIRILLSNARGSRSPLKRERIREAMRSANADVAIWTETHLNAQLSIPFANYFKATHSCLFSFGTSASCGIVLLWRANLEASFSLLQRDDDGRFLLVKVTLRDAPSFNIACVYAPNDDSERKDFFASLPWDLLSDSTILCGDFNCSTEPGDKVGGAKWRLSPSASFLRSATITHGMADPVVSLSKPQLATWMDSNRHIKSRIDRFYLSSNLSALLDDVDTRPHGVADHNEVVLQLNTSTIPRGPGYWKLNAMLLSDTIFVSELRSHIQFCIRDAPLGPGASCLDIVHSESTSLLQEEAFSQAYLRRFYLDRTDRRLKELEILVNSNPNDLKVWDEWLALHDTLGKEKLRLAEAARVRSRSCWKFSSERCTHSFMNLGKTRFQPNTIAHLSSTIPNDRRPAQEIAADFYEKLFQTRKCSFRKRRRLIKNIRSRLTQDAFDSLRQPLSLEEIQKAIALLPSNKSPGLDGLTAEFYKKFAPDLAPLLLATWNDSLLKGSLPESLRKGLISLLYKKGDKSDVANYRPITLMPTAYKIFSKALALRLAPLLPSLIGETQTGFISGRDIRTNVLGAKLGAEFASENFEHAGILFFDFEKAFDRLDRGFLWASMKKMNFPKEFIYSVQVLLNNSTAACIVNGHISRTFRVESGIRQGCCLSPLLFAIATEALRAASASHPRLQGFKIADQKLTTSLYADDTTGFVTTQSDIDTIMQLISLFEDGASMSLNRKKCRFLLLKGSLRPPLGISEVAEGESEPLLGGRLSHEIEDISSYSTIIAKMKSRIATWQRWNLSWYGRALIANVAILPLLWYFSSISATPDSVIQEVRSLIDQFIFNRTPCRISRADSVLPVTCGGIAAPHIEGYLLALKARWICMYLRNPFSLWARFFRWKIDRICFSLGISQPFSAALPASVKQFGLVGEALYAWSSIRKHPDHRVCSADLADSFPITANNSIPMQQKIRNRLAKAGIFELQDLLSDSGGWLTVDDIRSQYHIRLPPATLRSIQLAVPNRFIIAATTGHTKVSPGDWFELRCDATVTPHYLRVSSRSRSIINVQRFNIQEDGSLLPSPLDSHPLLLSDLERQYRKVFVVTMDGKNCLIGDLYQKSIILSKSDTNVEAPCLIDLDFRSLRALFLPPHRFSTPRVTLPAFDYERSYKWLASTIFDLPFRAFCLRLVHRKIPFRPEVPCYLCSKPCLSLDHVLRDCDVVDVFMEFFTQKCSQWFPNLPLHWDIPILFDVPLADYWNIASLCAKSAIYSQYWSIAFDNSSSTLSYLAIIRRWLKKLREFLLAVSLKGIKSRSRWNLNGLWILADGTLNMESLSL
jgi:exonuclease III